VYDLVLNHIIVAKS